MKGTNDSLTFRHLSFHLSFNTTKSPCRDSSPPSTVEESYRELVDLRQQVEVPEKHPVDTFPYLSHQAVLGVNDRVATVKEVGRIISLGDLQNTATVVEDVTLIPEVIINIDQVMTNNSWNLEEKIHETRELEIRENSLGPGSTEQGEPSLKTAPSTGTNKHGQNSPWAIEQNIVKISDRNRSTRNVEPRLRKCCPLNSILGEVLFEKNILNTDDRLT